jgi:hypothetical protein
MKMPMPLRTCPRHPEVKSLLERGHWPAAANSDLRTHAETCQACAQLVLLTQAFRQDSARARAQATPRLEAPGVLWWRAQLRRRNTAIERLQRPLVGAQIFAVALSLIAAVAFLAWQSKQGLAWFSDFPRAFHFESLLPEALQTPLGLTALIAAVLAIVAVLSGAVAYTTSEKR